MPTSNLALAPRIINLVHEVPHDRVLDVGPGWGKYSVLLREYLNVKPKVIDAVEGCPDYVKRHKLRDLYDTIYVKDVMLLEEKVLATYDVVLMVDVIEHLTKDDGIKLLQRIKGRVVICTPVEFFSNGPGLPWTETHRSHWTEKDFTATGRVETCGKAIGGWLVRLKPCQ